MYFTLHSIFSGISFSIILLIIIFLSFYGKVLSFSTYSKVKTYLEFNLILNTEWGDECINGFKTRGFFVVCPKIQKTKNNASILSSNCL